MRTFALFLCVTLAACGARPTPPDNGKDLTLTSRQEVTEGTCSAAETDEGVMISCNDGTSALLPNPPEPAPQGTLDLVEDENGCSILTSTTSEEVTEIGRICPPVPEAAPVEATQVLFARASARFVDPSMAADHNATASIDFPGLTIATLEIHSEGEWFEMQLSKGGSCGLVRDDSSVFNMSYSTSTFTRNDNVTSTCVISVEAPISGTYPARFQEFEFPNQAGGGVFFLPAGDHTFTFKLNPAPGYGLMFGVLVSMELSGTVKRLHNFTPPQ